MFRSTRNTGEWFDANKKGTVHDKPNQINMGPGKYNPSTETFKEKNPSHNKGKVPFGT